MLYGSNLFFRFFLNCMIIFCFSNFITNFREFFYSSPGLPKEHRKNGGVKSITLAHRRSPKWRREDNESSSLTTGHRREDKKLHTLCHNNVEKIRGTGVDPLVPTMSPAMSRKTRVSSRSRSKNRTLAFLIPYGCSLSLIPSYIKIMYFLFENRRSPRGFHLSDTPTQTQKIPQPYSFTPDIHQNLFRCKLTNFS